MARDKVDDVTVSLRLKHGIHTIFLFVDPLKPFSAVTTELLKVLRSRYPTGLLASSMPLRSTAIPKSDDDVTVHYAALVDASDKSKGWKDLNVLEDKDTPAGRKIKSGDALAFAFTVEDEQPQFVVQWPEAADEDEEDSRSRPYDPDGENDAEDADGPDDGYRR